MLKPIACALALVAALPATALAAEPVVQSEVVRFDDLNLAHPAGVDTLERRIQSAARRVCGYNDSYGTHLVSRDVSTCMTNALAAAKQQVALKTGTTSRKG